MKYTYKTAFTQRGTTTVHLRFIYSVGTLCGEWATGRMGLDPLPGETPTCLECLVLQQQYESLGHSEIAMVGQ